PLKLNAPVQALACTVLHGQPIAVIGTGYGSGADAQGGVYVWVLASGHLLGDPLKLNAPVQALACTVLHGQPIAVIGTGYGSGAQGGAYVWDLASRLLLGGPLKLNAPGQALACTAVDGRPIAVIGTKGRVHVWDLASRQLLGDPLKLNAPVQALACTELHGQPIAVIGTGYRYGADAQGGVYVWDLASREVLGEPLNSNHSVQALACTVLDGRPIAVIGTGYGYGYGYGADAQGGVYVWDLASRELLREPLSLNSRVQALACTVLDGRIVTVTLESGGHVRAWNVMDNFATTGLNTSFRDSLFTELACTVLDGRTVAVIATDTDTGAQDWVYVLDLTSGHPLGEPLKLNADVQALACTELHGRPIAVISTGTGTRTKGRVHVWDLASRQLLDNPLSLNAPVQALACTELHGRPIAVISTGINTDTTVYMWDLASRQFLDNPLSLNAPVQALACTELHGRPIAVIGAGTGTRTRPKGRVHVWDLASRQLLDKPLKLNGYVQALACTVLHGRPIAVIGIGTGYGSGSGSGGQGGAYVWDLASRELLGEPFSLNAPVQALACTVVDGRLIAAIGTSFFIGSGTVMYVGDIRACESMQQFALPDLEDLVFSGAEGLVVAVRRDIALLKRRSTQGGAGDSVTLDPTDIGRPRAARTLPQVSSTAADITELPPGQAVT
ncbi:WD40 repeat domain-containing protein, partial [Streptomyces sp. NPDC006235]|uniref:WD40 repeat domain-containing protein n=1 Tax=Streptomyces sp. NPDC006235 TaxID=3156736 RepID=UPI0033A1DD16